MLCVKCKTDVNKPEISKYNNCIVCLNCYIYLTGISYNNFKNENEIINNIINTINYKNIYFHFYYKFENKLNYKRRLSKFKKLDINILYNNGWQIHNVKNNNNIYIYKGSNFVAFVSISCILIYSRDSNIVFKIYDFVDLSDLKYLKFFIKTKLDILNPFLYLYS